MGKQLLRRGPQRLLLIAAACGVGVLSVAGIASAGPTLAPTSVTITAKFLQGKPFFLYSPRHPNIAQGGTLTIKNGRPGVPHSFTLVRQSLLPKTKPQRQNCFAPGHICFRAAAWHTGGNPTGPVTTNPVDVGQAGWDTEGGLHKRGDSIFFNRNRPQALPVSAPAGTTLHFMCIIHPWMQGTITVR